MTEDQQERVEATTLQVQEIYDICESGQLTLPKFQRELVWSKPQKESLINSLLQRFPIGTLLIHRKSNNDDSDENDLLVDGLQRVSTIIKYLDDPFMFNPIANVFSEEKDQEHGSTLETKILDLSNSLKKDWKISLDRDGLLSELDKFFRSRIQGKFPISFKETTLVRGFAQHMLDNSSLTKDSPDVIDSLNSPILSVESIGTGLVDLYEIIRKRLDIGYSDIPVLYYTGDGGKLPEIFELLNKQGTKLSKYDLLASQWYESTRVTDTPNEILEAIKDRYNDINKHGSIALDDYDDESIEYNVTLYDYLLGLGEVLQEQEGALVGEHNQGEIPFQITAVVNGLRLSKINELDQYLVAKVNGNQREICLEPFREALFETVTWLDDILKSLSTFPMNKRKRSSQNKSTRKESSKKGTSPKKLSHPELLIVSIISNLMLGRYDHKKNWQSRKITNPTKKKQASEVRQLYICETISNHWKGSGDSTLIKRVWKNYTTKQDPSQLEPLPIGYPFPKKDDLSQAYWSSFKEYSEKRAKKRSTPSSDGQIILRAAYAKLLSVDEAYRADLELDHIIPVSYTKRHYPNSEGWAINHWANYALMPLELNRRKGKKTLFEFLQEKEDIEDKKIEDKKSIEQLKDALILDPESLPKKYFDKTLSEEDFNVFLKKRADAIFELLAEDYPE